MSMPYIKIYRDFNETIAAMTDAEAGRLFKAVVSYANGDEANLSGAERYVFMMLKAQIDRDKEQYEKIAERNRANGQNGGRPVKTEINPVGFTGSQYKPNKPNKSQEKEKEKEEDKDKDEEERERTRARGEPMRFFGDYKHVALTDTQRARLDGKLGAADAAKYIRIVDEYAQKSGKRYGDYELTVEQAAREHWGEPRSSVQTAKDHPMITRNITEAEFGDDFYSGIMSRTRS